MSDVLEEWRPVPGYPKYEASNLGRVRTFARKLGGKIKSARVNTSGYLVMKLYRGGDERQFGVSVIVLLTFVGPAPEKHEAAHLDGNKLNNRLENLAWVTHQENMDHQKLHGTTTRGEKNPKCKISEADVRAIRAAWAAGVGSAALAKQFGLNRNSIRGIAIGVTWSHVA